MTCPSSSQEYRQNLIKVVMLKHLCYMQLGGVCSGLLVVRHSLPFLLLRALISFPLLHPAVAWDQSSTNSFPRHSDSSAQSLAMENTVETGLPPGNVQDMRIFVCLKLGSLKLPWTLPLSSQPCFGPCNPLCSLQISSFYFHCPEVVSLACHQRPLV